MTKREEVIKNKAAVIINDTIIVICSLRLLIVLFLFKTLWKKVIIKNHNKNIPNKTII
jgi:hypothetical protein